MTDTILAKLEQTLLVEVRSPDGPARGALVRFVPLERAGQPEVYVGPPDDTVYTADLYSRTNFLGVVAVHIKLGVHAGAARLHISAPELGFEDTARYTIQAGNPAQVIVTPGDTAVYAGASFQASAAVSDARGNPRTEMATFSALSAVTVTPTGGVTAGPTIARAAYVATVAGATDTAWVSIVPPATLIAFHEGSGKAVSFNLDGSGYHEIPSIFWLETPTWSPAGDRFAFAGALQPGVVWLYTSDLSGNVEQLGTRGDSGLSWVSWPAYSPDGQTLYFSGFTTASQYALWRADADGRNPHLLYADTSGYAWRGSPSPDGTRLAFVARNPAFIRVYTLASATVSSWSVPGHTPRWSPTSDSIAFATQFGGPLYLMGADGTGIRRVSAPNRGYGETSIAWSPDGVWLVANADVLELIHVASGLTLPLAYTGALVAPVWQP